jgi:beta-lactamase regulating signal transducer with metallopeptidase domain
MNALFAIEVVTAETFWTIAWQSTAWLAAGLALSAIWRRHPARAHVALVACVIAALVSPVFTLIAGTMQWGLLPAHEGDLIAVASPPQVAERGPARAPAATINQTAIDAALPALAEPALGRAATTRDEVADNGSVPWLTWSKLLSGLEVAWFAVTLVLAARLLQNLLSALRIVRRAEPVRDEELHECLRRATRNLTVAPPQLVRSPDCRCPMIWCWGRPVLFVPQDAAAETPLAWEAIFSHELAHLLRRDHLADLCGELAVVLLPWHPLAWLARARMHTLAEEACDDWAVAASGNAFDYAESLLMLVPQERTAALAAVTIRSSLGARVKRLLAERTVVPAAGWRFTAAVLAVSVLALGGAALGQRSVAVAANRTSESLASDPRLGELVQLKGSVVDENGQPIANANVSLISREYRRRQGGDLPASFRDGDNRSLTEAVTDDSGQFVFSLNRPSPKEREWMYLVARAAGKGLAWHRLNTDPLTELVRFELAAEQPIRGRLIDSDGQALGGVQLQIIGYSTKVIPPQLFSRNRVGFNGSQLPAAWPGVVTSDEQGRITILGVAPQHGVLIEAVATERTAPQQLSLNTGQPETRPENDATYRSSVVKNLKLGEEGVFVLAPAQPVGGSITYEDTGLPVDRGRVTVFSSDQKFGSAIGLGAAIARGRYRTSPYPGIQFVVTAYPSADSPYLPRRREFDWESNEKSTAIDIALPRGVLIRGQVINDETKAAISGARIVYEPQGDRDGFEDVVANWQAAQLTDDEGRFAMAVLPGPGYLLASAPAAKFVLYEIGSRTIALGKPGGQRTYAHAIHKVDFHVQGEPVDLTLSLTPSPEVVGSVVDDQGKPVQIARIISRLTSAPDTKWRGFRAGTAADGRFSLAGWNRGEKSSVSFWEPKRKIGATVQLGVRDVGRDLRIELLPAGSATMRFVDPRGNIVAGYQPTLYMVVTPGPPRSTADKSQWDQLAADSDFVANIDRENHSAHLKSGDDGRHQFEALIPGATYQIVTYVEGVAVIMKEFVAQPDKTLDLKDVVVPDQKDD